MIFPVFFAFLRWAFKILFIRFVMSWPLETIVLLTHFCNRSIFVMIQGGLNGILTLFACFLAESTGKSKLFSKKLCKCAEFR